jgi:hypothetical protein
MLTSLWDFGALDPKIEITYISSILKELNFDPPVLEIISECINECQSFIREDVEKNLSSVSLRDIQRVKEIIQFYYMVLLYKSKYSDGIESFDTFCLKTGLCSFDKSKIDLWIQAFMVSIYLCYVYRIFQLSKMMI